MTRGLLTAAVSGSAAVWLAAVGLAAAPPGRQPRIDYHAQIEPIVKRACLECHSQDKRRGGLSLAAYADALDGGRDGAVIRPGNGAGSAIIQRLTGALDPQMPKDEDPLRPAEIALFQAWIDQGARETPDGPPAPQPWEAPMELQRPPLPPIVWKDWTSRIDRTVAAYLADRHTAEPRIVDDALYARRVYLDIWGLPPAPDELQAFVSDRSPQKREALTARLLADGDGYAAHWISFWNDLLRNEDGVSYFSETAGRKSITDWLLQTLQTNLPYDRFVRALLDPANPGDPAGFLIGVNWRGETSAAVTPWMQASQNTAQVFLGVNLKCNACHDSFVSKWKLKDAYSLAAYFSPQPTLQLFRCDIAQNRYAEPAFIFPELAHEPASGSLADRRAAAAAAFTDPRNGRLARTLVNRVWLRLLGHGIVANPDEMDGRPWSPELLDTLAADFVEHGYDMKRLIAHIVTSRAYQMPTVPRRAEPPARGYVFAGPEVRRLTAEQFSDAIGAMTGEWNTYAGKPATPGGVYAREWRVASSSFTRALGRPVRDQITSTRPSEASPLQALELVNGEVYTRRLSRAAQRLLGQLPPETASLYNKSVAGRYAKAIDFDIDVSKASTLWLLVQDEGSNAPEKLRPIWADAELVSASSVVPLASLTPRDVKGIRHDDSPASGVRVSNPSALVYDIAGRGFTRFRGRLAIENAVSDIGSTLNPALRFYVFDAAPDMDRLIPPSPALPMPAPPVPRTIDAAIDWVFWYALGRAPSAAERRQAQTTLRQSGSAGPSADGLADLLWAVTMTPEFQFIN
ncbi:MAG TPA: PSD1 and planctomycete cytochrome C domain-containing protein [Vicinamibacterales bacterium]